MATHATRPPDSPAAPQPAGFFDRKAATAAFRLSDFQGGKRVRLGELSFAQAAQATPSSTEFLHNAWPMAGKVAPRAAQPEAPYYDIDLYPPAELGAGPDLIKARVRSITTVSWASWACEHHSDPLR